MYVNENFCNNFIYRHYHAVKLVVYLKEVMCVLVLNQRIVLSCSYNQIKLQMPVHYSIYQFISIQNLYITRITRKAYDFYSVN